MHAGATASVTRVSPSDPTTPPARTLGRLALRRIAVAAPAKPTAVGIVEEPWPPSEPPYSRTLWGAFLPDRRRIAGLAPRGGERRR